MAKADKREGQHTGELKKLLNQIAELEASETKLRQAENALQVSEGRYRSLVDDVLDSSQIGIIILDATFKMVWVNQSLECYFGLHRGEVLGKDIQWLIRERLKYIVEDPKGFVEKALATIENSTQAGRFECHVLANSDREEWWLEHWSQPIQSGLYAGGVVEYYTDITERKRAEEALRESEEKLRLMFESLSLGVSVTDLDGKIIEVNDAKVRMHGYDNKEELIGRDVFEHIAEKDHDRANEDRKKVLQSGLTKNDEHTFLTKDGRSFPAEVSLGVLRDSSGNSTGLIAITEDITERKRAEAALERAAREWKTTFDSITDMISIHDRDFRLVRVNKAFAAAFRAEPKQLIGKLCYEVVHGTNSCIPHCPVKKTFETQKPARLAFFEASLGIDFEVISSPVFGEKGEVVGCVHVARDVTEHKRMEEQLILTDRLASIGELASGIAHELNNPLTSVIGFSALALEKRDVPDNVREDLEVIHREAQRTAETVKHLLTFARKHAPAKQLVNLNDLIEEVLELRNYEQKVSNIEVVRKFATDLPEIMADYFQLQQVFLNIIINAEYFMIEAHSKGTLTITTNRVGEFVKISFTDDGPGITGENLKHIFDPFCTTKPVGKGTGLGLSICHGIVNTHGGRIYAESVLGKGATFFIELPIRAKTED